MSFRKKEGSPDPQEIVSSGRAPSTTSSD